MPAVQVEMSMMEKEAAQNEKSGVVPEVKVLSSQKILDPYAPIIAGLHKNRCEKCGSTGNLYVHLRDGDIRNRRLENLTLLCHKCKVEEDKKIFRAIMYDLVGTIYQEAEKVAVAVPGSIRQKERI